MKTLGGSISLLGASSFARRVQSTVDSFLSRCEMLQVRSHGWIDIERFVELVPSLQLHSSEETQRLWPEEVDAHQQRSSQREPATLLHGHHAGRKTKQSYTGRFLMRAKDTFRRFNAADWCTYCDDELCVANGKNGSRWPSLFARQPNELI